MTTYRRTPLDPTFGHRFRRHARLWRRFLIMAVSRELQFRANALGTILVGFAFIVVSLIPVWLLFEYTNTVNGWNRSEVLALVGLFQVVSGLMETFIRPSMIRFTGLVDRGDLDLILLRPVSSQFYVTLRWISPSSGFNIIAGFLILVIGLSRSEASPTILDIAMASSVALCGMVLLICAWSAMVYIVFWIISVMPIAQLFDDLWTAGGYPVVFFPPPIQIFLTFFFPVAFATTVPIDLLAGRGHWWQPLVAILAAGTAIFLIRIWWRFALRFYASASS